VGPELARGVHSHLLLLLLLLLQLLLKSPA